MKIFILEAIIKTHKKEMFLENQTFSYCKSFLANLYSTFQLSLETKFLQLFRLFLYLLGNNKGLYYRSTDQS